MTGRKFRPGFRLSAADVMVLAVSGIASAVAMTFEPWFGIAGAFVVLHFFLFCNVLRMSRPLELIWAGIFLALAAASISPNLLSWPVVLMISSVVTIVLAIIEVRRPSYHGAGWQRLNPNLPAWWRARSASNDEKVG